MQISYVKSGPVTRLSVWPCEPRRCWKGALKLTAFSKAPQFQLNSPEILAFIGSAFLCIWMFEYRLAGSNSR